LLIADVQVAFAAPTAAAAAAPQKAISSGVILSSERTHLFSGVAGSAPRAQVLRSAPVSDCLCAHLAAPVWALVTILEIATVHFSAESMQAPAFGATTKLAAIDTASEAAMVVVRIMFFSVRSCGVRGSGVTLHEVVATSLRVRVVDSSACGFSPTLA